MTQTEYEHKRRECWEEFWKDGNLTPHNINQAFNYAFDRAYALGKQQKTIAQEDIEKTAEAFATPPIGNGGMFTRQQVKELLVKFAQLLPGKQEKDVNTVIQGWVARDENERLCLYQNEPKRESYDFYPRGYWTDMTNQYIDFPPNLFPDLT